MTGFQYRVLYFIFWILGMSYLSYAQVDTFAQLPIHELTVPPLRTQSLGGNTQIWTTAQLQQSAANSVAELLQQEGNVYIKNYGAGSLATSSIRGGSAGHTLVLWNGLPIQSPMLGLLDLSLLPIGLMEEVQLQKGGHTSAWGSGAVGGLLALNNSFDQRDTNVVVQLHSRIGSFGLQQYQAKIAFGNKRFRVESKWFDQQTQNDFPFQAAPTLPITRQTNAAFRQRHWIQSLHLNLTDRQQLSAYFWQQTTARQLPPTITQTRSLANQQDEANRLFLQWHKVEQRGFLQAKTALFIEDLVYRNPIAKLVAASNFRTWLNEISKEYQWNNDHRTAFGGTHQLTEARTESYADGVQEQRLAFWANHTFSSEQWRFQIAARQEWIDGERVPFVPSVSAEYQLLNAVLLKAKASRNYRLATLNDRYWQPGGNPNLQAENGWSQEASVIWNQRNNTHFFTTESTVFNRQIDNWILWIPLEGQPFWSANNIASVWSRGLEQQLKWQWRTNALQLNHQLSYSYIQSTNQIALERPRLAKNEQLIYTPIHQAQAQIECLWKHFAFRYQHTFVGETRGINETISAYQLGQSSLQYHWSQGDHQVRFFTHIYNLWNADYFIVERRPMPNRNYTIGINYTFN